MKMRSEILCMALLVTALTGCGPGERVSPPPVTPDAGADVEYRVTTGLGENWQVRLDQAIGQIEKILSTLEQQQPMNYTISNLAILYDLKLELLFEEALASAKSDEVRQAYLSEQRAWHRHRDKKISAAYGEYGGGSLASFNAGQVAIDLARARIEEIEDL